MLAGVSVALSAGSKVRRGMEPRAAARAVMARGLWVFALAYAFRVQAWILGWSAARALLKVDILNIMGPSIVGAGALWGAFRTPRARAAAFGTVTLAIALLTPLVHGARALNALPDPLEAYIRPVQSLSNFSLFPWAGFLFAGGLAGVLIDGARTRETEARLNALLFGWGTAVAIAAYLASYLPSPYAHSMFWSSSPAFFLLRAGLIMAAIGIAYAWNARSVRLREQAQPWSPLQQLGRTSLFIYWIHVEMVYGLISLRIHKGLSFGAALAAYAAFSVFMLGCSIAKDRIAARRANRDSTNSAKPLAGMSLWSNLGRRQKTPRGALSLKP
jgi:uncharacterized membrane protein